jgi:hypothetical protein
MKIDLRDTTFVIPVKFDHADRRRNLELVVCMLQRDFDTTIIIGEQGGNTFEYMSKWCKYVRFEDEEFRRTKFINCMAGMCETDIFVNLDSDVLIAPMQLLTAVEAVRSGDYEFAYPYQYAFVRVPKIKHRNIYPHYDLAAFAPIMNGSDTLVRPSVGGAVIFNKEVFQRYGGENENFVSFSPEDVERYERFTRLGCRCFRPKGHLYHLDHHVGVNSSKQNPFYQQGVDELQKERQMNIDELKAYVKTWTKKISAK